jgi:uncharacterized protein (TIGR02001 family)
METKQALQFAKVFSSGALAAALAYSAALADPARTPRSTGPCAGVYLATSGLSDYRFNGFSESNRSPTWQVTAYCYNSRGYFVGTTLTSVDFADTPRTNVEADWYGGRQFAVGRYNATLTLLYASFPDKRAPGPSYNILEPEAEVSRAIDRLTLKGLVAWSTSATSRSWQVKASVAYRLTSWLGLNADAGHFWEVDGFDHDIWDVGATATLRRFTLGAHYGGTTQTRSQCFATDWCAPGPAISLMYRLLP